MITKTAKLDKETKKKLIEENLYLVKYIAGKLTANYGENAKNEFDDFCSYGILGLIDAANKYNPNMNVKFPTYAHIRIKGAIIDNIRKNDWVSRQTRKKIKEIQTIYDKYENVFGRQPTDEEAAMELNLSVEEYRQRLTEISGYNLVSMEEILEKSGVVIISSEKDNPETAYELTELKQTIAKVIDSLSEQQKTVISLYYYEDLTYKEIAKILKVSESRISQIHTKAIMKLKNKLFYQLQAAR